MTYPEPPTLFSSTFDAVTHCDRLIKISNSRHGGDLEITHIQGVGWQLELRVDVVDTTTLRQPFTGDQADLEKSNLFSSKVGDRLVITEPKGTELHISPDGCFQLQINGTPFFTSTSSPFLGHERRVPLSNLMKSRQSADLKDDFSFIRHAGTFDSHMRQFRLPRPVGPVLGLPGCTGEFNRNGYRFELYNTDRWEHTPSRAPLYQSWPIVFFKTRPDTWVSVLYDNPTRTFVDIGDFYTDSMVFESVTGNIRVLICCGETLELCSSRMTTALGAPPLLPAWAYGYQQSRWSYYSESHVRKVLDAFKREELPLDAIYLDIDYMDGYRVFTTDQARFPDLRGLIEEVHEQGKKIIAVFDPGVKKEESFEVYKDLLSHGKVLRTRDSGPLTVDVWAGPSVLPDFLDSTTSAWWSALQRRFLREFPLDGIWNDMNEPSNGHGSSGNAAVAECETSLGKFESFYNLYGLYMAKSSREGWDRPERPFVITRSGYPGVQKHSIIWHGDNAAWWEHLRLALRTAVNYALCGAFYTGADVPGFQQNPPDDLAVRFFQLGSYLPFFRGHSDLLSCNKEPYVFGDTARRIIYASIRTRYSLLREWYSYFELATRTMTPPITPVFSQQGSLIQDQFLLFGKYVVAPVIERDALVRAVYLPTGDWYRLGDPTTILSGGTFIMEETSLDTIPVFVRAGAIVVRGTVASTARETLSGEEKLEIYYDRGRHAEGYWYNDDLENIEISSYSRVRLIADHDSIIRVPAD